MVLDHIDRVAYAVRSERTDPIVLERFCTRFSFEPMMSSAKDPSGFEIYHTNVLMCVATDFAMIGLDMITVSRRLSAWARRAYLDPVDYRTVGIETEQIDIWRERAAAAASNSYGRAGRRFRAMHDR